MFVRKEGYLNAMLKESETSVFLLLVKDQFICMILILMFDIYGIFAIIT